MSGQLEHITPGMDEEQALGLALDEMIDQAEPDMSEAVRLCAVPHWFNEDILAWLRGEERKPSGRTLEILSKMTSLPFVGSHQDRGYEYQKNIRNLLLHRWRKNNAKRFEELSVRTAAYFTNTLRSEKLSEQQRAEWEYEEMYHLLAADKKHGIERFISLSKRAIDTYKLSTLDLLLSMAGEQADDLSAEDQLWIPFFEGKKHVVSNNWEQALKVWEKLIEKRKQFAPELEKTFAVNLSILYKEMGEWNKAIMCFQDSLKILEEARDENGMADILNNRGFLYKDKGEWQKAKEDFESAFQKFEKIGDEYGQTISLKNLGLLYKDNRKWDEAIQRFEESLAILQRLGDERGMAITYNDLGFLYKDKGTLYKDEETWDQAIKYFEQSWKILDTLGDEQGTAAAFNNLGFLYIDKQDWENARKNFENAYKIFEKLGDEHRKADTLSYLGTLYRDKKDWKEADKHFQDALTLLKKMSDERGMATILRNLGLLYQRKEEREKAAYFFLRSLKIVEEVGDEMNAATMMYELALLYEEMQEYGEAIELLEKVVKIYERVGHPDLRIGGSSELLAGVKAKAALNASHQ
jgi:tetratricopeptide (TPR) repeat protein